MIFSIHKMLLAYFQLLADIRSLLNSWFPVGHNVEDAARCVEHVK
jgi:hypothetical protein